MAQGQEHTVFCRTLFELLGVSQLDSNSCNHKQPKEEAGDCE